MDYAALNESITEKMLKALAIINNPEIAPDVRQLNQEILFKEVGDAIYAKVYDMNAYDFEIEHTKGSGMDDRHFGMAKVASASVATGTLGLGLLVRNYLDSAAAKAQEDAFINAKQSRKHPRVIRSVVGETCKWCTSLAGTYDSPTPDAFKRHRACDCKIVTQGYRSRNGELKNYVKPKDR